MYRLTVSLWRPNSLAILRMDMPSSLAFCTDMNVTAGIRHVYRVKAINAAGAGPQSNYFLVEP